MCFKKPKLPEKTEEDKRAEEELEQARLSRKRQLAYDLRSEKDAQTEAALARALGFTGNRSLLTGPKGGAGYMGPGSRKVSKSLIAPSAPNTGVVPPRAAPNAPVIAGAGGPGASAGKGGRGSSFTNGSTGSLLQVY